LSFATAFQGLGVLMPVIGYATWHGYRDTTQAADWPSNQTHSGASTVAGP
jgi:uncharacterized membrane protein